MPDERDLIHVLVVDDSAVLRQILSGLLAKQPDMTVEVAADPLVALRRMKLRHPDVILLDLEMPRMDGLTFLRKLMTEDPVPVVVCSAHAKEGAELALKALEAGAVEVLTKPGMAERGNYAEEMTLLLDALRAAAKTRTGPWRHLPPVPPRLTADAVLAPRAPPPIGVGETVVALGASTGGTQVVQQVLDEVGAGAPGVVVVQHMPKHFTTAFAERLNRSCVLQVKEAEDGDRIQGGLVLVAPGDRHALLAAGEEGLEIRLTDGPLVQRHRPSVDVLFRSMAQAVGSRGVGVLMTGMGEDGVAGLGEMRQAGALTVAQDEASCAVYGMPRRAVETGAAQRVATPREIAEIVSLGG